MIYSIIHYPKNHNEHIIYTTTNITQACYALEEFAIRALEKVCGHLIIQKDHPRPDFLKKRETEYYAISKLNQIEIWRLKPGWVYNGRSLCSTYKIIRCSYQLQHKQKKMSLKAINEDLLNEIRKEGHS